MYEVVHMSRSDSFCFCQRLARIFELASYNKCHYAILNINILEYWQSEEAHGRTEGLSRAWGVSFLRHPSSFFPPMRFFFFSMQCSGDGKLLTFHLITSPAGVNVNQTPLQLPVRKSREEEELQQNLRSSEGLMGRSRRITESSSQ